ncbi:GMC oxidoreductase [Ketobacter sp.]|uniref:GMC oxidoreductase n=1 Tax=Ketobacter sp. TaxID=2083498 RepID=UPI000F26967E|nr:GMC oxidoreductase [Ketobacter sp.]RLT95360.1 MAG: GMC family oxidoreductase [Ketobacter sp.]
MKNQFSRRKFIKNGVYVTAATGLASTLGCGGDVPTIHSIKKAAVIGSGFGGSVTALRLGEAGISTALIERGQRWSYTGPDSFPTLLSMSQGDGRTTWLSDFDAPSGQIPVNRHAGMLERIEGDTVDSVVGAGLGGGSLVYGGVLLQPREEIFNEIFPYLDYAQMARDFYPKVLGKVSGGPIPDDILGTPFYKAKQAFIQNATAAGMMVVRSDVGFNWNIIRKELTGELPLAASIGEYVFCCNSNAKNTLDKNYIAEAEATGKVTVNTLHNVKTITRVGRKGPYVVHCEVIDVEGNVVMNHLIGCEYLFMAAGSLNTTKLLLKAKALGDLRGINDAVGAHWAANGDELMARIGVTSDLGPVQGGPPSIAAWDFNNSIKPVGFMHSPANSAPGQPPTQLQMAMCKPDQPGTLSYLKDSDKVFINWPMEANGYARQAHMESLQKIAAFSGGMPLPDLALGRPTMWHPLGGATMGEATDIETGELYGQPNLFVMDGALMPGSTAAANPSLTIAANAERIMANLIPRIA